MMDDGNRHHVIAKYNAMISAIAAHASPGKARISIAPKRATYAEIWDEFQGCARPLWPWPRSLKVAMAMCRAPNI